jgi:hypothetical protein
MVLSCHASLHCLYCMTGCGILDEVLTSNMNCRIPHQSSHSYVEDEALRAPCVTPLRSLAGHCRASWCGFQCVHMQITPGTQLNARVSKQGTVIGIMSWLNEGFL